MLSEKLKEYSGITDEALKKLFLPDGITPPHMHLGTPSPWFILSAGYGLWQAEQ